MTGTPKLPSTFNSFVTKTKFFCRNKLSELISCTEMILRTGTRKNYRIWFLSTSGISSCGISQGKTISVNWLLCYRFFLLGTPPSTEMTKNTHFFTAIFKKQSVFKVSCSSFNNCFCFCFTRQKSGVESLSITYHYIIIYTSVLRILDLEKWSQ